MTKFLDVLKVSSYLIPHYFTFISTFSHFPISSFLPNILYVFFFFLLSYFFPSLSLSLLHLFLFSHFFPFSSSLLFTFPLTILLSLSHFFLYVFSLFQYFLSFFSSSIFLLTLSSIYTFPPLPLLSFFSSHFPLLVIYPLLSCFLLLSSLIRVLPLFQLSLLLHFPPFIALLPPFISSSLQWSNSMQNV